MDTPTPSLITAFAPGHIDRDRELVVGLETGTEVTATGQRVRAIERRRRRSGYGASSLHPDSSCCASGAAASSAK
ncbi:hypothetical protein [Actinomadura decatromicini]|uniref:Uncharacterized protein n=1 Tax=Actinomadura decatromicini TaxID=2604572 RepID=A0A5D3F4Z5_9ACTN|nr:hypothetical protein [Actinomadura decatromicini]TYK43054.1 hypothetical protein FXF68_39935 [Actinomadura decatromicini]